MKKTLVTVASALTLIVSLSVLPSNMKIGPFGVDVVSAASETTPAPAPTPTKTSTTTKPSVSSLLRYGSRGEAVKSLQTTLNNNGAKLKVDGIFGVKTLAAVKDFQKKNSLKVDGLVGPKTFEKLYPAPVVTTPAEPVVTTPPVDVVATASLTDNAAVFAKSLGTEGRWIISALKDLTINEDLVLEGEFKNGKKDAVTGADIIQRKIALYTQDDKHVVLQRFTLTAPTLTIKSPNARIQSGTFKGDIYVSVANFQLVDTKVEGNVYFASEEIKKSFNMDAKSSVTGVQEVKASGKTAIKLGKAEFAAHGTKCFTIAVVAMAGDKIAAASIDDYQFMAPTGTVAVPNSDKDFAANYKDPAKYVLASKRLNAEAYSKNMKERGGATLSLDQNFGAVQAFVVGKTIAQLEEIRKTNSTDPKVDAVSGATLTDTNGYLDAIIAAAKASSKNSAFEVDSSAVSSIKVGKFEYAAHGTKCFTVASVAVLGDKIVGSYLDDYQFMAPTGTVAVPNSDKDFAANYKDPAKYVLASKRLNAEAYSKNMKERGGATLSLDQNFEAVQAFVTGKTLAELEAAAKTNDTDPKVDAVTSATLTDTTGYLNAFVGAAKAAK